MVRSLIARSNKAVLDYFYSPDQRQLALRLCNPKLSSTRRIQ